MQQRRRETQENSPAAPAAASIANLDDATDDELMVALSSQAEPVSSFLIINIFHTDANQPLLCFHADVWQC